MTSLPRLYFTGSQLHNGSGNEFRLVNITDEPILTHNMISSHHVFHRRKNTPSNNNIFRVQLANNIVKHIRNYPARATLTNFQQMTNAIIKKRIRDQARYRAQYNVLTKNMQNKLSAANETRRLNRNTVPEHETNQKRTERLRRINRAYRNKQEMITNTYLNHNVIKKYRNHANQIIYWKWIQNSVLPVLRTKFKNIRR
jgi:leucyl aminopeptidase (aminopeptidase T)